MPIWIQSNIGNIIVLLILLAVVLLAIRSIANDRRSGKSGCGSNCGACAMSGACHRHPQARDKRDGSFCHVPRPAGGQSGSVKT